MENNKNNAVEKMENVMNNNANAQKNEDELKREEYAKARLHKKEEKARLKAMLKRDKERKKKERQSVKEAKRKNGKKSNAGYLSAIIALSISTIALAGVLTFTMVMPSSEETSLQASYTRAFYDTVKEVENIDANLSKALATGDDGAMQIYLVDTAINAELAEASMQELPLEDSGKFYTCKLINQIGDYAKYLNKKLVNGETLSEQDLEALRGLYENNVRLREMLENTANEMGNDFSFTSISEGDTGNLFIKGFNDLENLSSEYPELIYDGPFSDGRDNREVKGISGKEIDEGEAKSIFTQIFGDYNPQDTRVEGKTMANIECYNVMAQVKDELLYAQISVKGGKLIMFSYAGSCMDTVIDRDTAEKVAQDFLDKNGFENMKAVWVNSTANVYTINFAHENNGVIVYSDLVKVRVCAETSMIIGVEAVEYFTNHTARNIESAKITETVAADKLSSSMQVQTARLALVPEGNEKETLCYEFNCLSGGDTYYIYISATNGRQVQMFRVINSSEGEMLI